MRELIGTCQHCGKNVYCENGFFDGDQKDGALLCNYCAEEQEKSSN
ncbi:MAG TPA: hypothetical protein VK105_13105 [Virgibacillus sp.]|nr:hypothetical protein [Virgibacillus sp.]HLR68045.1 hypothetical protein [Virgibacillus sp.]